MSKAKKKDLGTNIVYRIVLAVLAVGVPLSAFFAKLFYAVIDSDVIKMINSLQGNTDDTGATEVTYSIKEIISMFSQSEGGSSNMGAKIWESISGIHGELICIAVFFALAILSALAIFIFNFFSKKRFVTLCLGGFGTLSLIAMLISFNAAASPILDGTISLSTLLSSSLLGSSLLSGLMSYVASVSILRLASAWYVMLFLFIGIIVWAGAYMLIESGERKSK